MPVANSPFAGQPATTAQAARNVARRTPYPFCRSHGRRRHDLRHRRPNRSDRVRPRTVCVGSPAERSQRTGARETSKRARLRPTCQATASATPEEASPGRSAVSVRSSAGGSASVRHRLGPGEQQHAHADSTSAPIRTAPPSACRTTTRRRRSGRGDRDRDLQLGPSARPGGRGARRALDSSSPTRTRRRPQRRPRSPRRRVPDSISSLTISWSRTRPGHRRRHRRSAATPATSRRLGDRGDRERAEQPERDRKAGVAGDGARLGRRGRRSARPRRRDSDHTRGGRRRAEKRTPSPSRRKGRGQHRLYEGQRRLGQGQDLGAQPAIASPIAASRSACARGGPAAPGASGAPSARAGPRTPQRVAGVIGDRRQRAIPKPAANSESIIRRPLSAGGQRRGRPGPRSSRVLGLGLGRRRRASGWRR